MTWTSLRRHYDPPGNSTWLTVPDVPIKQLNVRHLQRRPERQKRLRHDPSLRASPSPWRSNRPNKRRLTEFPSLLTLKFPSNRSEPQTSTHKSNLPYPLSMITTRNFVTLLITSYTRYLSLRTQLNVTNAHDAHPHSLLLIHHLTPTLYLLTPIKDPTPQNFPCNDGNDPTHGHAIGSKMSPPTQNSPYLPATHGRLPMMPKSHAHNNAPHPSRYQLLNTRLPMLQVSLYMVLPLLIMNNTVHIRFYHLKATT